MANIGYARDGTVEPGAGLVGEAWDGARSRTEANAGQTGQDAALSTVGSDNAFICNPSVFRWMGQHDPFVFCLCDATAKPSIGEPSDMKKAVPTTGFFGQDGTYSTGPLIEEGFVVLRIKRRDASFGMQRSGFLSQAACTENRRSILRCGAIPDPINPYRASRPPRFRSEPECSSKMRQNLHQSSSSKRNGQAATSRQSGQASFYPKSPSAAARLFWLLFLSISLCYPCRALAQELNYEKLETVLQQYGLNNALQAISLVLMHNECPETTLCSDVKEALSLKQVDDSPNRRTRYKYKVQGDGYLLKDNEIARRELAVFFSRDTNIDISELQRLFLVWHFSNSMTYSNNIFDVINNENCLVVGWNNYAIFSKKSISSIYTFGVIGCTVVLLSSGNGYYMLSHNEARGNPGEYNSEIAYWEMKQFLDNFPVKTVWVVGFYADGVAKMLRKRNKNLKIYTHSFKEDYSSSRQIFVDVHDGVRFFVEENPVDKEYLRQIQAQEIDFPFRAYPWADMTRILPQRSSHWKPIVFPQSPALVQIP